MDKREVLFQMPAFHEKNKNVNTFHPLTHKDSQPFTYTFSGYYYIDTILAGTHTGSLVL